MYPDSRNDIINVLYMFLFYQLYWPFMQAYLL